MTRVSRLRLKGWWAFGLWTVVWSFSWAAVADQPDPWPALGVLALLVAAIVARLRAAPAGALAGFGLLLTVGCLVGDFNLGGALAGLATIAVGALLFEAGIRIGRRFQRSRASRA